MRAGNLRHLVVIQRATVARDAHGQETRTWARLATVKADIQPIRAREFVEGGATVSDVSHKIIMRHFPGLLPTDRILYAQRTFNIAAVINPGERNIMTEVIATEVL